ncbi:MAG: PKD domain-containing protein [Saprospiraceae bacterium]|nr:PKD domain-containing protein [Saprospiraceae bacterium]
MNKIYTAILFLVVVNHSVSFTQTIFIKEKRDYVWLLGYNSNFVDTSVGGTRIDFNHSPPLLSYEYRNLDFDITNAAICDTSGNLLFYTNGIAIHAPTIPQGQQIANGGGLNPDPYTQQWASRGYNLYQGALILSVPDSLGKYYLLHGERTTFPEGIFGNYRIVAKLYQTTIAMSVPGWVVTAKNQILINDTLDFGKITTVRHANGRDWWLLQQEYFSNRYYLLRVSPSGVSLEAPQTVGQATPSGLGQAVFSPDGSKYVRYTGHDAASGQFIDIYDFDRCTGLLSDLAQINYNDTAFSGGVAISPNSRFLYVSSFRYIYQYDLWAEDIEASKETVAVYDGVLTPPPFALPTRFFLCQLAPDGKIYISATSGIRFLHIIHNPNAWGVACHVEQRGLELPTYNAFGIPNHPYYGLGPEDGSPCDTLGIDHHPQAAFRHAEQELEATFWDYSLFFPTSWQWDFGDGSAGSTEQNPVHEYAAPGVYEVCLTVSNENASDTHCEWVEVTVTTTGEVTPAGMAVKVYPNPAKDYVVIEPQQRLPQGAFWVLRDALGRELRRAPLPEGQPQLVLNLEGLPGGVYICSIEAGGVERWKGKVIK